MLAQHISLALRLGDSQANPRRHQFAFCDVELAVDAFLQPLLANELCFLGRGLRLGRSRSLP